MLVGYLDGLSKASVLIQEAGKLRVCASQSVFGEELVKIVGPIAEVVDGFKKLCMALGVPDGTALSPAIASAREGAYEGVNKQKKCRCKKRGKATP